MTRGSIAFILISFGLAGAAVAQEQAAIAAPSVVQTPTTLEHLGICDASAAVAAGPGEFLVANDECAHVKESDDCNKLLVYKSDVTGKAVQEIDITSFMALEKKKKEADIEGSAALGGRVYWTSSHGRNKDGEVKKNRQQLFAMEVKQTNDRVVLSPVGKPYSNLLTDLLADNRFQALTRERLAPQDDPSLAPEKEGAINIEGLSAWQGGQLLIGFRNPLKEGKAVLVPIENPADLISGKDQAAKLGDPISLDLGGRGIRSIEFWEQRQIFLILAGPMGKVAPGTEKPFRLYQWSGKREEAPQEVADADLADLNPEAIVVYPELGDRVQVLSDDGEVQVGGDACKDLADVHPGKKFRSRWIQVPILEALRGTGVKPVR
jgi:hypothetical protein